jgi:hypothetical protein
MKPIESMRGVSPVRSTSEEVGDTDTVVATHEITGGPCSAPERLAATRRSAVHESVR